MSETTKYLISGVAFMLAVFMLCGALAHNRLRQLDEAYAQPAASAQP